MAALTPLFLTDQLFIALVVIGVACTTIVIARSRRHLRQSEAGDRAETPRPRRDVGHPAERGWGRCRVVPYAMLASRSGFSRAGISS